MNTTTRTRMRIAAGVVGLASLLGACSSGTPTATVAPTPMSTTATSAPSPTASSGTPAGSASPTTSATPALLDSLRLTAADGASAALAAVGSGRVVAIDLEREQGTVVWRVDVLTADTVRELDVDASSGAVLADRSDSDDVDELRALLDAASVDHARALEVALVEFADGRVVDLELDDDDDRPVWDVDVLVPGPVEHEVTVDASTGAITKNERR